MIKLARGSPLASLHVKLARKVPARCEKSPCSVRGGRRRHSSGSHVVRNWLTIAAGRIFNLDRSFSNFCFFGSVVRTGVTVFTVFRVQKPPTNTPAAPNPIRFCHREFSFVAIGNNGSTQPTAGAREKLFNQRGEMSGRIRRTM